MPRGFQLLVRVFAGLAGCALLAQCSNSSALAPVETPAIATTYATAPSTTIASSTTLAESTTTITLAPTTTTILEPTTIPEPTTTTTPAPVIDPDCPTTPHAAVIDRDRQRAWLCDNGVAMPEFVITTAREQPDPGTYPVYAKSMNTSSTFGGHYSTMTHFVAFTRGEETGARVAFHTVPVLKNGEFVQPLTSVGTQVRRGEPAGCIRVLPDQGPVIWDWLQKGDEVRVIN